MEILNFNQAMAKRLGFLGTLADDIWFGYEDGTLYIYGKLSACEFLKGSRRLMAIVARPIQLEYQFISIVAAKGEEYELVERFNIAMLIETDYY